MKKLFGILLAVGAAAVLTASPAAAATDPAQLVKSITAEVGAIARSQTGSNREAAIAQVLRRHFDWPAMARAALGVHWNGASERQRARLLVALETIESRAYSQRLGKLAGYDIKIEKVTPRDGGTWDVASLIDQAGGFPMRLTWEVRDSGQGPRIADVRVVGVSLSMTKRSEFHSHIQRNGGAIEPLIQELEERAGR
ncbi:MAG: ABC transporter substrate-binding protein [Alphaproteobacteria bacterium]|nr:ABC transporter substrate-binding protein [Alphaproteobacteria bacterium]